MNWIFVSYKLYFLLFLSQRVTVFSSFVSCPSLPWICYLSRCTQNGPSPMFLSAYLPRTEPRKNGGWMVMGVQTERSCSQQRLLQSRSSSSCLLTALVLPPRSPRTLCAEWDALCLRRRLRLSSFHLLHKHTAIRHSLCLYWWLFFHDAVNICFSLISVHPELLTLVCFFVGKVVSFRYKMFTFASFKMLWGFCS